MTDTTIALSGLSCTIPDFRNCEVDRDDHDDHDHTDDIDDIDDIDDHDDDDDDDDDGFGPQY